jgi:hypothetical protein
VVILSKHNTSYERAVRRLPRVRYARVKTKSPPSFSRLFRAPSARSYFLLAALASYSPITVMFKYIFRFRIGGWWLLGGVWRKRVSPFHYYSLSTGSAREVWLRVFWLEVGISKLPF